MDVLERILGKKIIAIIRGFKLDETLKTADAVAAGGLGLLEVPFDPVSYTHLDVYKRQVFMPGMISSILWKNRSSS